MIVFGDLACPTEVHSKYVGKFLNDHREIFRDHSWLFNLEGLICKTRPAGDNKAILYNHPTIPGFLRNPFGSIVSLANNHTPDLPECLSNTLHELDKQEIKHLGAGQSEELAEQPVFIRENDHEYIILSYCWKLLINSNHPKDNPLYINTLKESSVLHDVATLRMKYPDRKIVTYLHWNLDLETLPFPMHRQFARKLIDNGADLIVGSHSHCVQGAEEYKGKHIFYGIGNFFIPWKEFISGRLQYPEISRRQLVVEYKPNNDTCVCHWFDYTLKEGISELDHAGSYPFETDPVLKEYTPYNDMGYHEYIRYFRKNRRKRKLLPVYKNIDQKLRNRLLDHYLKNRIRMARILAKANLWSWAK